MKRKNIFSILFFSIFFNCWSLDLSNDSLSVFLCLGQSNMGGYGQILPEDREDIEGVYVLRDTVNPKKSFSWVNANQPINKRLPSDRFSLVGPFAKVHRSMYPDVEVGIVSVAWGGAAISQMSKGTPFYEEIIRKALWAKRSGRLKAVLWHQGESDTVLPELADTYSEKLEKLIRDLRTDLQMPDLPFIIGDLAEFYGTGKEHSAPDRLKRIKQVRETLRTMQNKLPDVGFVPTTGLVSHDFHQVHFNRASYIILGHRYFDVYWTKFAVK